MCDDSTLPLSIPPVLTLPSEIRGQIFNLLSARDATHCRLACHHFKADVDEFVEFSAEFDETKGNQNGWFLPRILNLRLREVIIKCLVGPPCLFGHVGTQLLRHPNLLRRLRVPNSKISVENMHYLLLDSATSLQYLDLCLFQPVSTTSTALKLSSATFSYKLKHLKNLVLILSTLPPTPEEATAFVENQVMRGPPTPLVEDSIPILLLSSTLSCIRSIRIQIRCLGFRQASQLSALVLRLVSRSSTLKSLDFDLIQGHGFPPSEERPLSDADMETLDLASLERVTSLQDVRIVNSTAVGISLWKQLLANQKKLLSIETDILPASAALFRQIILNNTSTLVEVDIGDLTLDLDEGTGVISPFDMSVFSDCSRLKKLTLDRNSLTRRRGPVFEVELVQLSYLPESLSELNLNYFLINSEELLLFFNRSCQNLTSISLTQCGDSGNFGVNGSTLQAILTLPTIQYIEVSPLNHEEVNGPEVQKLNLILLTFGYPERHSYFQLKRVTSTSGRDIDESKVDMNDLELV